MPTIRKHKSHNGRTLPPGTREKFLEAYEKLGTVEKACHAIGIGRRTVYEWRDRDAKFAAEMERVYQTATALLEDEAFRRAYDGWEEPVFYQGQPAGIWLDDEGKPVGNDLARATRFQQFGVRKFSDALLMFQLKMRKPEYRDSMKISNPDGSALSLIVNLSDATLAAIATGRG